MGYHGILNKILNCSKSFTLLEYVCLTFVDKNVDVNQTYMFLCAGLCSPVVKILGNKIDFPEYYTYCVNALYKQMYETGEVQFQHRSNKPLDYLN
jgi:hypothetical protein